MMKFACLAFLSILAVVGCSRREPQRPAAASSAPAGDHGHTPPHGGTPIVLGNEEFHLELVLDEPTGRLSAYVMDGHFLLFVRCADPALELEAIVAGQPKTLLLTPVADRATGETTGDTALYAAEAEWLKTNPKWEGTLRKITLRDRTFENVKFSFPKGNE